MVALLLRVCVIAAVCAASLCSAASVRRDGDDASLTVERAADGKVKNYAPRGHSNGEDATTIVTRRHRRQATEDSTQATLPGGITVPTLPDTLPTLPGELTVPTLPATLPGGLTVPTLPATLPGDLTLPTIPTGNITLPTLPSNITLPNITLPGGVTLPPNVTLPSVVTLPENFTLPTVVTIPENVTIPSLPFNITLPTDILQNVTLPPFLNNLTFPPFENFTLPPLPSAFPTFPTALTDLLNNLLAGDVPTLDSLLTNALTAEVSANCSRSWDSLFNTTDNDGISNGLRAVDSFGKLGAGYLQGNMYALGSYDQCFSIPDTKYCLSDLVFTMDSDEVENPELFYALCLPQTCTTDDIQQAINSTNNQLNIFNITIRVSSISCENETKASYNAGAVIMILIWCLITIVVVGVTVFQGVVFTSMQKHKSQKDGIEISDRTLSIGQNDRKSAVSKLLSSFSLCTVVPKLLCTESPETNAITSLHGLKVLSLLWIILGHTHLWSFFFDSNSSHVEKNVMTRYSYQAVLSSPFGFDTFFLISGVLIAYVALNKMAKKKKEKSIRNYLTLTFHYVRRLLHFTPVYAIILFSFWLLTVHFTDGPVWRRTVGVGSTMYENCEKYWWTNFFYINNLYPWANLDECMPWTWYLSTEIQFYVAAPLLLIPLSIFYPIGLVVVALFLVANVVTLGGITGWHELSATIFLDIDSSVDAENIVPEGHNSIDDIHIKPWTRIGPFVLGILLGFLLFKKLKASFGKLNCIVYTILWIVASGLCYATVYGTYGAYDNKDSLTEGEEIAYQMFSRLSWSAGVAIIVYVCHHGYGGYVNNFLSMKIWTPLSRLSLITYLVHPVVLFVLFYTLRQPVYHTNVTMAVYTIATVILSYGAAGIIATFVDFPLRHLETTALKMVGFGGETDKDNQQEHEVEEREMEEGIVVQQNYLFRELDKEEQKRMEAEEGESETDTRAKELSTI